MEILEWINRLKFNQDLFGMVDQHYFKYLLFTKLTSGSGLKAKDAKQCQCDYDERTLTITLTMKKKVDIPSLADIVEENMYGFDCYVSCTGNTLTIVIRSEKEEVYTVANLLTANA